MLKTTLRRAMAAAVVAMVLAAVAPLSAGAADVVGVVDFDAGDWYSTAVLSDGTLWSWGYNAQGQLGDGTEKDHFAPSQISGAQWSSVSAGRRHTLALKADNTLWAWGYNRTGQLGIGHADPPPPAPEHPHRSPEQVGTGLWLDAYAGADHSLGIDETGELWAWGANDFGQLGIGSTTPSTVPVKVQLSSPLPQGVFWRRAWAGEGVSYAVTSDGRIWQWGLGVSAPAVVPFTDTVTSGLAAADASWLTFSSADERAVAVTANTVLWSWMSGGPQPYSFGDEAADIGETRDSVNDAEFALMLGQDQLLWVATNAQGRICALLGDNGLSQLAEWSLLSNARDWSSLNPGVNHVLIRKDDGSLWGWGKNTFGQLGDGKETDRLSKTTEPVRAMLPNPIPAVVTMSETDAKNEIQNKGFTVGPVTRVVSTVVDETKVISQSPAANTLVLPGTAVNIVVSAGPPVPVPNVIGMLEASARTAISNAGLGVSLVTEAYSSTVPAGKVISQSPTPGTSVIKASKVSFVVSKGPALKSVPYVNGRTLEQARSLLTGAGFKPGTVIKEYSTAVAAGLVTRSAPAAGVRVYEGSTVNLYVSLGKPKVSVSTPIAPSTAKKLVACTVYGYLAPKHTAGTYPVKIFKWKKTSSGTWKAYGYQNAVAVSITGVTSKSKYKASVKFPYAGTWRVRAYAIEDTKHAATWSPGYDTVTVR